jgi:hypothetical protein
MPPQNGDFFFHIDSGVLSRHPESGRFRRMSRLWTYLAVSAGLAQATPAQSQELAPEVRLIARIKAHVLAQVASVLDYTCLETMQRYRKPPGRQTVMKPLDTVRLDVLYTGSRELYSSPGARHFAEEHPEAFFGSGLIGDGIFATFVNSVFADRQAVYTYRGRDDLRGLQVARYDFRVSSLTNGLTIKVEGGTAVTGIEGSFWADPESLDLVRLEVHPDELPFYLGVRGMSTTLDYAPVRIGSRDLIVPQSAEVWLAQTSGEESLNVVGFTQCRKFEAESSVSFSSGTAGGTLAAPAQPASLAHPVVPPRDIPAGLELALRLTAAIDKDTSVGALIEATVPEDVRLKGRIVIPKGTAVTGRLRQLEKHSDMGDYWVVSLEFIEIERSGSTERFFADWISADRIPGYDSVLSTGSSRTFELSNGGRTYVSHTGNQHLPDLPGVASFFVKGGQLDLPKGFQTIWRTKK